VAKYVDVNMVKPWMPRRFPCQSRDPYYVGSAMCARTTQERLARHLLATTPGKIQRSATEQVEWLYLQRWLVSSWCGAGPTRGDTKGTPYPGPVGKVAWADESTVHTFICNQAQYYFCKAVIKITINLFVNLSTGAILSSYTLKHMETKCKFRQRQQKIGGSVWVFVPVAKLLSEAPVWCQQKYLRSLLAVRFFGSS